MVYPCHPPSTHKMMLITRIIMKIYQYQKKKTSMRYECWKHPPNEEDMVLVVMLVLLDSNDTDNDNEMIINQLYYHQPPPTIMPSPEQEKQTTTIITIITLRHPFKSNHSAITIVIVTIIMSIMRIKVLPSNLLLLLMVHHSYRITIMRLYYYRLP